MYSKRQFGQELRIQLEKGYDLQTISIWADNTFFVHQRELEKGLYEPLMRVAMMEMGPEFQLSKSELLSISDELLTS